MGGPVGWILEEADRVHLLDRFPPRYERVIAHHVTLWGHRKRAPVPPPASLAVVGHAADDAIEALIVAVDGTTRRPDGNTYHCTWSIDPGSNREPKDSNNMIAATQWTRITPLPFAAVPGYVV